MEEDYLEFADFDKSKTGIVIDNNDKEPKNKGSKSQRKKKNRRPKFAIEQWTSINLRSNLTQLFQYYFHIKYFSQN